MPECGEKSMQPVCLMHVAAASTATTALAALLKPRKFSTGCQAVHRQKTAGPVKSEEKQGEMLRS
jgi:hypothetical protein